MALSKRCDFSSEMQLIINYTFHYCLDNKLPLCGGPSRSPTGRKSTGACLKSELLCSFFPWVTNCKQWEQSPKLALF